ncbi:MAG TPA: hypothetical protein VEA69_07450 [Tepidisphaeraceae bacterium]|nr:hypothetical protein [Tepidisphaeraceae bacterium]
MPTLCPNCRIALPAPGNRCPACGPVITAAPAAPAPPALEKRLDPAAASWIRVEERGQTLVLRWRWFQWGHIVIALGVAVFLVFFVLSVLMAIAYGTGPRAVPAIWLMPLALGSATGYLGYRTLADLLNSTTLTVTPGDALTVRHGPLPWPGNATWPAARLTQVYCVATKSYRTSEGRDFSKPYFVFSLHALLTDGTSARISMGPPVTDTDLPRRLERLIERHLGLPDRPVEGEFVCATDRAPAR